MTNDLDALLTALYVKIDDEITDTRWLGRPPRLTDSELVCLAVAQAMLGFTSESRWLRFVHSRLGKMFPFVPKQPGWNKRLRAALPLVKRAVRLLATDTDFWFDNHWIIDSTPVECGRSRPTVKRSDLAGWAGYGYCASHSRFFWGLRLYLVCTPTGMPILWSLANPKLDEREVLTAMLDREPDTVTDRPSLLLKAALKLSAAALSALDPIAPMLCRTPVDLQISAKALLEYCEPWSVCMIAPARLPRVRSATVRASMTSLVRM
ncbi:hypothetical protein OG816_39140 [Streptomyces sp. NBC_00073]